jgi:hypothetical protein
MIDRAELRTELEEQFLGFIPDKSDLEKLEKKIELSKPVIQDLKIEVSHAYGIHQVLLEWHLENYELLRTKAEISLEILEEKYQKFN